MENGASSPFAVDRRDSLRNGLVVLLRDDVVLNVAVHVGQPVLAALGFAWGQASLGDRSLFGSKVCYNSFNYEKYSPVRTFLDSQAIAAINKATNSLDKDR